MICSMRMIIAWCISHLPYLAMLPETASHPAAWQLPTEHSNQLLPHTDHGAEAHAKLSEGDALHAA